MNITHNSISTGPDFDPAFSVRTMDSAEFHAAVMLQSQDMLYILTHFIRLPGLRYCQIDTRTPGDYIWHATDCFTVCQPRLNAHERIRSYSKAHRDAKLRPTRRTRWVHTFCTPGRC